ncbi:MAG: hypothetical protein IKO93_08230, partial [Lentisphaeria bacterium]|nr:hypothetical protein [Lentisphaeria bacterium]
REHGKNGRPCPSTGCTPDHQDRILRRQLLVRYANGQEEKIPAPNLNGGGHNGADMVTLRKFFDYVDAGIPEASEPERILSSVMIPMAAMSNQLVQTGEWYRSIISSRG